MLSCLHNTLHENESHGDYDLLGPHGYVTVLKGYKKQRTPPRFLTQPYSSSSYEQQIIQQIILKYHTTVTLWHATADRPATALGPAHVTVARAAHAKTVGWVQFK